MRQLLKIISGLLLKLFNKHSDALIGRVLSPHGVGGMVKVFPCSDYPERAELLDLVDLIRGAERWTVQVENAAIYGRFWLLKFKGIDSREEAARLRDSMIVIPKADRFTLPEGSFYHDQLVGLRVYTADRVMVGHITDVISTGGHDLYVVEPPGGEGKKHLLPAIRQFIKDVDLEAGSMIVDLPEGLLEL